MLNGDIHPSTIEGVKRLATKIRKERGIKHADALNLAAQAAKCTNFRHAQRILTDRGRKRNYVLLTVYWQDRNGYEVGRETLELLLSKPIVEVCSKADLKLLRGFGTMRMVASDHFVSDELAQSQEIARDRICTAVRSLRFAEHTGLRPSRDYRKAYVEGTAGNKLPGSDHATDWVDPATGQFILVDEPYSGVPKEDERVAWAAHHNWRVAKTSWPGMYNPYNCDLYVAANSGDGYDLDALIAKIEGLPLPLISNEWVGESAPSLEVFVSPAATTLQDKRRARSQATIFPTQSATTIPYRMMFGGRERRPVGAPGLLTHVEMGRMIKAVLRSRMRPHGVYRRMDSLRSTLEDWMALEIGREKLDGPEFFDVYYHEEDGDAAYEEAATSRDGVIRILSDLKAKLAVAYPNCKPLRRQLHRIEMSISLIRKKALAA